jgi:lysophospholipase L1-like esterase
MTSATKNILLSVVTVFIILSLLELSTRVLFDPVSRANFTPIPRSILMKPSFPGAPYVLRPNGTGTQHFGTNPEGYFDEGATLTYKINSLGFRGNETTVEKPANTVRIVGIGDSFTFGSGVRNDDTFLSVLESNVTGTRDNTRVEVLNLGVGGYNTVHELGLLYHTGVKYQPDIVVLCFFLNDTNAGGTAQAFGPRLQEDQLPFWRRHSRLADILASRLERQQAARKLVNNYNESYQPDAAGWVRSRKALRQARTLAEQHDFKLVLVIFPVLWNLSDSYPFLDIHQTISEFASSIDIPVLDLLPEFNGFNGPELWAHPNNQHPNAKGHAIAGNALAGFLATNYPSIIRNSRHQPLLDSLQNNP